ncbi:MAG: YesL family protein [Lachnospiraceae bacterium]|nr:YesL family protein [Lachnospiraceae bacterium]
MRKKLDDFFSWDGKVMELLRRAGELILLNIVFLISCIPIVTIGSALTSFYYATIKSIRRERGTVLGEYFGSMKRTMKKGILLVLELAVWFGLLYIGRRYSQVNERPHMTVVYNVLMLISAAVAVYVFPVLSRFEMKLTNCWKLAFLMCIRFFPYTVVIAAGTAGIAWLQFYILPMPCILFVPGLWCLGITFLMEQALLAYMPKPEEGQEDAWYYDTGKPEKENDKKDNMQKGKVGRGLRMKKGLFSAGRQSAQRDGPEKNL